MERKRLTQVYASEDDIGKKRERLTDKFAAAAGTDKKRQTTKAILQRNLEGFDYDPSKAKILKKSLHNLNVALGSMIGAMKDLSLLRGSEITPDGLLGGRGFIMDFKEIKLLMNEAINNLSNITDTVADELTNPKWELSKDEKVKVREEKQEVDDKIEKIEEMTKPEGAKPEEQKKTEEIPDPEIPSALDVLDKPSLDEIKPEDVKDSAEMESLKRYKDLLEGKTADKAASILSKSILANLLKGE